MIMRDTSQTVTFTMDCSGIIEVLNTVYCAGMRGEVFSRHERTTRGREAAPLLYPCRNPTGYYDCWGFTFAIFIFHLNLNVIGFRSVAVCIKGKGLFENKRMFIHFWYKRQLNDTPITMDSKYILQKWIPNIRITLALVVFLSFEFGGFRGRWWAWTRASAYAEDEDTTADSLRCNWRQLHQSPIGRHGNPMGLYLWGVGWTISLS